MTPERVTITIETRGDGGLRVYSDDVRGLILSHSDPEKVMGDVLTAVRVLRPAFDAALAPRVQAMLDV